MTAHRCLFADGPIDDLNVLVTGGAGAVGQAAIQLARFGGAQVVATVSTPEKARIAADAGARAVLGYREPTFLADLRGAARGGIDRVVDVAMATNLSTYLELLNPHAVMSCYAREAVDVSVPSALLIGANVTLRFVGVYGGTRAALDVATEDITAALGSGSLQPLPTHRYPLARTEEAHEACRSGVTGKVLIDVAQI